MNTTDASPAAPPFATAGVLLEAIAAPDFDRLTDALDDGATMSALLPGGFRQWEGAPAIRDAFARWFGGDVEHFEVADASVGQIGALLELRWRLRLRGTRFGATTKVVEQHVFAATAANGLISHMSLLCSGFWDEQPGS